MPKFIIKTFGCKTNQYESEGIREALTSIGWSESIHINEVEVAIINTCTVTSRAGASARNTIRKLLKSNPNLRIILTGCAVDVDEKWIKELQIEEVFKNTEKHQISSYLQNSNHAEKKSGNGFDFSINNFEGHTRAFIKIHDGCDNFCSYCIIPFARGVPRSRESSSIIDEARTLSQNGYKELVLTGINIGAYQHNNQSLPELLEMLTELPEISRIRLGSIEPIYLTESLLLCIKNNPKICSHLHLPLQSGSNSVLKAMNRKYTKEFFLECIQKSREILDNPAITTDIIVGFPTEDESCFNETLQTIASIGFARSHIFLFSPREGTPAAEMKRPPQRDADNRRLILEDITTKQAKEYSKSLISFDNESLMIEKITKNKAYGYLERYIRAELEIEPQTHIIKSETYKVNINKVKETAKNQSQESENTVVCNLKV